MEILSLQAMSNQIQNQGGFVNSQHVREVYVHGRLEHRMIDYIDTSNGYLRVPVMTGDERAHYTLDGKCYIVTIKKQ